ncbi:hypothetical protein ACFQ51_30265 [Streptomyces kaempferi]
MRVHDVAGLVRCDDVQQIAAVQLLPPPSVLSLSREARTKAAFWMDPPPALGRSQTAQRFVEPASEAAGRRSGA